MTSENADVVANSLFRLPHMYDKMPQLAIWPTIPPAANMRSIYAWANEPPSWDRKPRSNVYVCRGGFSGEAYSGVISQWDKTLVPAGTSMPPARYVTIDDLRMMAYVGIEYARAKLYGWRYRFGDLGEDGSIYPRGHIVRIANGKRYVHRVGEGTTIAPYESGGPYGDNKQLSYSAWTPMQRMAGFGASEVGHMSLPIGFAPSDELTSNFFELDSLEGKNDILRISPYYSKVAGAVIESGGDTPVVRKGSFSIVLATGEGEKNNIDYDTDIIVFQQTTRPLYRLFNTIGDYYANTNFVYAWEKGDSKYSKTSYIRDTVSSMIPLKKGVVYRVFVKFANALIGADNPLHPLCSYWRKPIRMTAPRI